MRINQLLSTLAIFSTFVITSCTWEQQTPTVDCSVSSVTATLVENSSASCGTANGSFTISATGGESPYLFSFEEGTNTTGQFTDIAAGTYAVVVTDAKGCTASLAVSIANQDGVNVSNVTSTASGCDSSNGSITVSATGGEEPYGYSIDGVAQSGNVFTGLSSGTYDVSVHDQLGCETSQTVEILSGVSYESSIKSIIANSCATTSCHGGSVSPDLRTFSTIQSKASSIKTRTGNKSMPKGSSLTQEEIDLIACWVDDGALAN